MKQGMFKRLDALEERQVAALRLEDRRSERLEAIHLAMSVGFALRLGVKAQEELEEENGSIDPGRRAELEKQVAAAGSIAGLLAKHSNRRTA